MYNMFKPWPIDNFFFGKSSQRFFLIFCRIPYFSNRVHDWQLFVRPPQGGIGRGEKRRGGGGMAHFNERRGRRDLGFLSPVDSWLYCSGYMWENGRKKRRPDWARLDDTAEEKREQYWMQFWEFRGLWEFGRHIFCLIRFCTWAMSEIFEISIYHLRALFICRCDSSRILGVSVHYFLFHCAP